MTRLIQQPIAVELTAECLPHAFTWERARYHITSILNNWRIHQHWWEPTSIQREYYQVVTDSELIADLYYDTSTSNWMLERVYD